SPTNHAPLVNAGADQTVTLPGSASLVGAVSDDGLPAGSHLSSLWSAVSGPGSVSFANISSPTTSATFSSAGTYQLRLSATDGELSSFDDVFISVKSP